MATQRNIVWISEEEAAKMMGYKPKVFRRYVQEGKLNISSTRLNYRTIEYNRVDIDTLKMRNANLVLA